MKKVLFLLSLFVFVLSLVTGQANAGKDVDEKLSAKLRQQMAEKNDYTAKPSHEKLKTLKSLGLQEMESHVVFLHFTKEPSTRQLKALTRSGVKVFDNSWIPPVGKHTTGFMTAKIPIGVIRKVAGKSFIRRIETAEQVLMPLNDLAAEAIYANVPSVWGAGHNGSGVKIAVLDSGLDTSHQDIPTPLVAKDYSSFPLIDDDVENRVIGHGAHVSVSALGLGVLSNGKYKGIAHGADLIFLKIGDDFSGSANFYAMASAIKAAVDDYGADVINVSYGGFDPYKDGSDEICQTVDYARSKGVLVFCAAGNESDKKKHYSATLKSDKTDCAEFTTIGGYLVFDLNWFDGVGVNNDLSVKVFDTDENEVSNLFYIFRDIESPRGTEFVTLSGNLPAGNYHIHVTNNSDCEQMFHIYSLIPWVTFPNADPMFTIQTPALADGAVTIASSVTRTSWTNWLSDFYDFGGIIGTVSKFSSRGPRIDGAEKPQLTAPGEWIISARDKIQLLGGADYLIIDNDGVSDGKGPANYTTLKGTSMASPIAAGGAAVLISANPSLKGNPDTVLKAMQETASNGGNWNQNSGYGLIDLQAALEGIEIPIPTPNETPTPEPTPTPEVGGGGGDEPPPKDVFEVQSTDPKDGATDVETDVKIVLVYNQNISSDPEYTLNESAVELRVEGTETNLAVDVSVMAYPDNKKLQIVPLKPLYLGTIYTLKVPWNTAKAANAGGTQMVSDFKMKFTTVVE